MKELPLLKPIIPSDMDKENWAQLQEWLNDIFIEPIAKRFPALKLTGYSGTEADDYGNGCHILMFNYDPRNSGFTAEEFDELTEMCTKDDDSQPFSTLRMYFGTLWIFIPYCI